MTANQKQLFCVFLVGILIGFLCSVLFKQYDVYHREQLIRRSIAENPLSALPLVRLANLQFENGHYERALSTLEHAFEVEPNCLEPYFAILNFYIDVKHDLLASRKYLMLAREVAEKKPTPDQTELYMIIRYEELLSLMLSDKRVTTVN